MIIARPNLNKKVNIYNFKIKLNIWIEIQKKIKAWVVLRAFVITLKGVF